MNGKDVLTAVAILVLASGCTQYEPATIESIRSDMAGNLGRPVRLDGTVVKRGSVMYVWIGPGDYFRLDDGTGSMNIWFGPGMRCAPRTGSSVTVHGKVAKPDEKSPHVFQAREVTIESSPPLGENEVRLCQLSGNEIRIHEMQGRGALEAYWKERGEPVRKVIY